MTLRCGASMWMLETPLQFQETIVPSFHSMAVHLPSGGCMVFWIILHRSGLWLSSLQEKRRPWKSPVIRAQLPTGTLAPAAPTYKTRMAIKTILAVSFTNYCVCSPLRLVVLSDNQLFAYNSGLPSLSISCVPSVLAQPYVPLLNIHSVHQILPVLMILVVVLSLLPTSPM